ncbi:hypothetical protein SAMN05660337_1678 [Maridesulfovibrio ferrireducens]|uniref:Uncharacterized protein n=1 Tax=Maridesulfovibrio ferrireducens TaxID=246191 RepID=A0A1G9FS03_9BACT|nr:retron St85 family effector protein [Maridesulfovibrio ferrireducens]SDK91184.1 hypothetical protein SAMN05660337_1678 [Maridesulfovibrio ferrireducens]
MLPHSIVTDQIRKNECFLRQDALIVFVCGRALSASGSKRKLFLDYARKHIQGFHFLLAEDLFKVRGTRGSDLLTTEKDLANYSDCIIIILESESAFAELGAFAVLDDLCKIILPINDKSFEKSDSFINLGPLEKIDSYKKGLGPTIHANMDSFAHCFSEVQTRLNKIQMRRRKRLKINEYSSFITNDKERLLLIYDIINIFAPIKKNEIINVFKSIYGSKRFDKINFDVLLLVTLGFIQEFDGFYFSSRPGLRFIDFATDSYFQLKSEIIIHYKKKDPQRLRLLGKVSSDAR